MSNSDYESDDGMAVEEENNEEDSCDDENHHTDDDCKSSNAANKERRQVYLPGHQMQEDESLIFDPSAYHMLHDIDSGELHINQ